MQYIKYNAIFGNGILEIPYKTQIRNILIQITNFLEKQIGASILGFQANIFDKVMIHLLYMASNL